MKLGELFISVEYVSEIVKSCKLPASKAFDLAVFVKKTNAELASFEELRLAKAKELGDESEGTVKVRDENKEEFEQYCNELLSREIECKTPDIRVSDLGDYEIETSKLLALSWLVKPNPEESPE